MLNCWKTTVKNGPSGIAEANVLAERDCRNINLAFQGLNISIRREPPKVRFRKGRTTMKYQCRHFARQTHAKKLSNMRMS